MHRLIWLLLSTWTPAQDAPRNALPPAGQSAPPAPVAPAPQQPPPGEQTAPGQAGVPAASGDALLSGTITELLQRADALLREGKDDDAVRVFEEVINRDPKNVEAKVGLGLVGERKQNWNAARMFFKEALEIDDSDHRANFGLGRAYLNMKYYRQALYHLEKAERVAPQNVLAELKVHMASAYRNSGSRSKAKQYAAEAVQLDPRNISAREVLIAARLDDKEFDAALGDAEVIIEEATRRLRENPADATNVQILISAMDIKLGVLNQHHQTFYQKDPSGAVTEKLLPYQEANAAKVLKQIINTLVQQVELRRTLSMYPLIVFTKRATEYDPRDPELMMMLGLLYLNTSQVASAIECFQKVLELDPNHAQAAEQLRLLNAPLRREVPPETPPAAPVDALPPPPAEPARPAGAGPGR